MVADYESSITFKKFIMEDPIWRPDRKNNSQTSIILVSITCTGVFEVADHESGFRF